MPARRLEHFNVWTSRLDETVQFYTDLLGLRNGDRPDFGLPGAWLYDDTGTPVVHLVDKDAALASDLPQTIGRTVSADRGSGTIDHIAFEATDQQGLASRLTERGLDFQSTEVPGAAIRQIFVKDPNGILIELNFR